MSTNDEVILRRLARLPDLTMTDTSMLLLAMKDFPRCASIASSLHHTIRGASWQWMVDTPIEEVTLRLLALHEYEPSTIDGVCAAHFAKRLMSIEESVGGPYDTKNPNALYINALLAQLFSSFGTPLPNVMSYITKSLQDTPDYLDTAIGAWSVSSPYQLVSSTHTSPSSQSLSEVSFVQETVAWLCLNRQQTTQQTAIASHKKTSYNSVTQFVRHELQLLDEPLKRRSLELWKLIARVDAKQEISMLASFFGSSLRTPLGEEGSGLSQQLGVANFYTWMAYTIYDDFIDEEGKPLQLPAANSMHRSAVKYYQEASSKQAKHDLIHTVFNAMDNANTWELENARCTIEGNMIYIASIPDYGDGSILADRAKAHVLGPLILAQFYQDSSALQRVKLDKALSHYLIARQLNDDIHDWTEDLTNGHISFVVAYLLQAIDITPGYHDLVMLRKRIQHYFWESGMEAITKLILDHVATGKRYLQRSQFLTPGSPFVRHTFQPIERSARKSLEIHTNQMQFLETYKTA